MRLKLVEINGFKSFPDKVSISFDEGLIAIVGPNGSGKSNVVDAVRWVLGEQSSKTLRGGKMEDVIFSGTQHRKAVGMAEVSLVLDNADGALPTPLTEVRVTRRLYRSGESEYLLAGRPVRLKDIHELFMNTGIGRDGYSLIGQGKIAEVLSNRSEDRRAMFEEAAGISKYRYRRTESLRRLEAAESNLVRLRDILEGYARQVGPLRVQSEKARRYLDLRQERRGLEINVWLDRLEQTKDLISKSADDCDIVTAQLEGISQKQGELERETASLDEAGQQLNLRMDEVLRSQRELEQGMAQAKSDAAVMENELRHNRERRQAVTQGMEQTKERRQALLDRQAEAQARAVQLAAHREELQARLDLLTRQATGGLLEQTQQRMAQLRIRQLDLGDALGRLPRGRGQRPDGGRRPGGKRGAGAGRAQAAGAGRAAGAGGVWKRPGSVKRSCRSCCSGPAIQWEATRKSWRRAGRKRRLHGQRSSRPRTSACRPSSACARWRIWKRTGRASRAPLSWCCRRPATEDCRACTGRCPP